MMPRLARVRRPDSQRSRTQRDGSVNSGSLEPISRSSLVTVPVRRTTPDEPPSRARRPKSSGAQRSDRRGLTTANKLAWPGGGWYTVFRDDLATDHRHDVSVGAL